MHIRQIKNRKEEDVCVLAIKMRLSNRLQSLSRSQAWRGGETQQGEWPSVSAAVSMMTGVDQMFFGSGWIHGLR